jgi:hypothetical protein
MIDPISLEDLQNHIKQYKTGGNVMPTDVAEAVSYTHLDAADESVSV